MNFINTIIPINFYLIALPFLFTSGNSDHNREILSQSRAQQAVGKTIQSSIEDLEALIADLESNGLIQDDMAEKMYSARLVLNQLNSNNIPEAVSRLRAAAIGNAGRLGNLQEATKEIDIILGELKKTAKDIGNEQKRAAYEQMLTQLFSDSEKLQEQTLKWGEEQLLSPDLADLSKQSALEKQSEIESQMDAFKDMLKNEIAEQNDLSMKQELEEVLDSLEGFEMDQSANDQKESSNQDLPEFDLMPEQEANPEGENFADLQNPDPSKMFQQELATNQFNQSESKNNEKVENTQESESKNEEMVKKNKQNPKDISAEKALQKSADAMASNDPSSALEAQEDFQERIQQALQAMGSMMAQNTQEPINEENVSNANMSLSPSALGAFSEAAMSLNEEDLLDEMSFGNQSGGSEIGDADLEALLSGESEEELGGAGDGSGQGEESQNDENSLASTNSSQSGKSSSGQNADQQKTNQNNKNNQNQPGQQMAQSSGGKPSTPSGASSSPFPPPMMSPGNGPPGDGSGMSTASFDKPHGTHYETTQIKSGGGPVSGNYSKTLQSKRNLAEVARQAITQDYQRRLPVEYRLMTAEYFELLGSLEE